MAKYEIEPFPEGKAVEHPLWVICEYDFGTGEAGSYWPIAYCPTEEDAKRICTLLNAQVHERLRREA